MSNEEKKYGVYPSPFGRLFIGRRGNALRFCDWEGSRYLPEHLQGYKHDQSDPLIVMATEQLNEYFEGSQEIFNLPLVFEGPTLSLDVWTFLEFVKYGRTMTYGAFAELCGFPKAIRAVAHAVATNPFSVFVPCHRIVGAHSLGGYAGGIDVKRQMLDLEQASLRRIATDKVSD